MWFLAPPSACTRLPCDVPLAVDVLGDRRGADEADGRDPRMFEDVVDGFLVAVDDVEDAVGQAGFLQQFGDAGSTALGSRSLGLRMKQLPQASGERGHPERAPSRGS